MKLGLVVDGHWGFIRELLSDWQIYYTTSIFSYHDIGLPYAQYRVNSWRRRQALSHFVNQTDVTFVEWAGPLTVAVSSLPVVRPIVVRLHSWELFEYAPNVEWDAISRVILVSRAMNRRFAELYPEQAIKTTVVNNGISIDRFQPRWRTFSGNIGMLCNITPIKRVYEAILVLHELRKAGYQLNLRIGGTPRNSSEDQRYYASVRHAIDVLSLHDHVSFHGWVEDVPLWLEDVDIFLSNSYWEGQQVALIEAMAAGCYCLAHFWDGAEEVLPPENLFATEAELKAKLIEHCERSETERRQLQEYSRTVAREKFDVEQTRRQIRAVIDEAVAW